MSRLRLHRVRPSRGVTLMELMVTLALVSVLVLILVPTYTSHVQKSRRADAKNALLDLAAREERFNATNNTYVASGTTLGYTSAFPLTIMSSGVGSYTLTVTQGVTTFSATATAIGPQASDPCGNFTLTDQGTQTSSGSQTAPPCW